MEYSWDSAQHKPTAVTFTSNVSAPAGDGYIMPRGFNVLYKAGSGKSTTATLTGPLYYYVAVPSNLVSSFQLVNASTSQWDGPALVKSRVTRYSFFGPNKPVTNLANGAYDGLWNVYRLTFKGSNTNTTALMTTTSEPSSWPGSTFTLVGKDAPVVDDAKVPYWCGAVGSFTTGDGVSATMIGSVIPKWTKPGP
ncbi:hypothetical protein O6R08_08990 [Cutibacterium equinum]|uniref:Uncharacterized protein n=1 Tax=Cutibacterium equinum TaxID=3016342 RepID=A0ABY7QZ12_9ACTN|nr:hypothetical protein [Cutibacterium equinum]WCC79623.1 hypothetical protein O6R08_08990 [Cutibacterium equinum]